MVDELGKCLDSPYYFAITFCETLNVEAGSIEKFPDYPYLQDFFENNIIPHNEHLEKSRQMLISWAFMALFLWDITFLDNIGDFITSRKEFLVDDGGSTSTPNSLMGRIRFMYERLPEGIKPELDITYLKIKNPKTNSYIIGESSNPNAGRSGTWHRALMDEAALIPKSESVYASIKQACKNGLVMNSTPYGRGGCFGRIKFDSGTTFGKRNCHWSKHPERDKAWYDEQCKDMTSDQVARELDISYEKSVAGQIYHMFDFSSQVGEYKYNPDLPLYTTWDFGIGNPTAVLWIQEAPIPEWKYPEIRIIDELEDHEKSPPYYADIVNNKPYTKRNAYGRNVLDYDNHFGDPAGKQRELNMKSWISWLDDLGINIKVRHGLKKAYTIQTGQRVMPYVKVDKGCVRFLECLTNYKHPTDEQGMVISDGYEENWATHIMKAFEYYAVNRFPMKKSIIGVI
tara:strand:+ start:299 stop:1666 length:1368 start_codon:yes stop_codon:yes gene_type:complete